MSAFPDLDDETVEKLRNDEDIGDIVEAYIRVKEEQDDE